MPCHRAKLLLQLKKVNVLTIIIHMFWLIVAQICFLVGWIMVWSIVRGIFLLIYSDKLSYEVLDSARLPLTNLHPKQQSPVLIYTAQS